MVLFIVSSGGIGRGGGVGGRTDGLTDGACFLVLLDSWGVMMQLIITNRSHFLSLLSCTFILVIVGEHHGERGILLVVKRVLRLRSQSLTAHCWRHCWQHCWRYSSSAYCFNAHKKP